MPFPNEELDLVSSTCKIPMTSMIDQVSGAETLYLRGGEVSWEQERLLSAAECGDVAEVSRLLKDLIDFDINAIDAEFCQCNPLILATANGHLGVVREVVARGGADVDFMDDKGETSLMFAAGNGHSLIVRELVAQGANLDGKSGCMNDTALIWAARNGHLVVVQELVKGGACIAHKNMNGNNALLYARNNRHGEVVAFLEAHVAQVAAKAEAAVGMQRAEASVAANSVAANVQAQNRKAELLHQRDDRSSFASLGGVGTILTFKNDTDVVAKAETQVEAEGETEQHEGRDLMNKEGSNNRFAPFTRVTAAPSAATNLFSTVTDLEAAVGHDTEERTAGKFSAKNLGTRRNRKLLALLKLW